MAMITELNCNLREAVHVKYLDGNLFSQDVYGNALRVIVMDGDEPATLAGTVSGTAIREDGSTVALTDSRSDEKVATVVLPAAAYAVPGVLAITIKISDTNTVTTLAYVVANVYRTSTDTVVDPGTIIPSITTLIEQIAQAVASIPADYSSLWAALAETFNASKSGGYAVGEYVTYDGGLYRFKNAHTGSWSSSDVDAVNLGSGIAKNASDISDLKSATKVYDAVEIAPFTDSGSYSIGAVGSVVGDPSLSASSTMLCYKFSCSPGDVFEFDIYGSGTSSGGARAYGWLNANNEVISRADRSVKVEGIQYAPEGAAFLVVNTLKTYGGYVIKGNRISAELVENDNNWKGVHNLIPANTKSRPFVWKSAGSDSYPTGWRTGYIDNTGTYQTSTSYIRTVLIPSAKIKGATACLIVPPTGYFAWVDVFVNDTVGSGNFVAQHGNYFKHETGKEIYFNLSEGQSFVVSLGKFNSDAGDYLTETFTKTIGCTLFFSNKSDYAGKKLSLLGDSISALAGDIPEGNKVYYTGSNMGILNSSQMWYSVLCNELGMIPLVINGWSGSCVTSGVRSDSTYKPASDASRCEALHDGTTKPDVVLIAMGVNDYSYMEDAAQFGTWDGSTALGEQSDMSDYVNTDFKRAYATMIARIRRKYPEAQIVCVTPWFVCRKTTDTGVTYLNAIGKKENDYGEVIREIASIMNVQVVDGTNIGLNRYNMYPTYAEDSSSIPTHPNAMGHALMGHAIATQLVNLPAK